MRKMLNLPSWQNVLVLGLTVALAPCTIPTRSLSKEDPPAIDIQIPIEVQNDWNYRSEDPAERRNNLSTSVEPEVTIKILPDLSLLAHGVLEEVRDPAPGEDRYFEDHGLFLEDFYLLYDKPYFFFQGGKFTPRFGLAWNEAPGLYGSDFAEDGYEFSERIGVSSGVKLGNDRVGMHTLSAATFFLDTSPLSESIFTTRDRRKHSDGGVGNTEDFSSYVATLDGSSIGGLSGLRYRISYTHQRAGAGDQSDENGVSIGVTNKFKLGHGVDLSPLVEYARFADADGVEGQEREFLTLSTLLEKGGWNAALSFTARNAQAPDGTDTNDMLFQVSAGYRFHNGLGIDIGWRFANEGNVQTETLGLLLTYTFSRPTK